jgi:iron complex outermembrane recepter protein
MTRKILGLPFGAARLLVSIVFVMGLGRATAGLAQEEAPPADIPPENAAPAEAPPAEAPADAAAAPADAAPADPAGEVGSVPVDPAPTADQQAQQEAGDKSGTQLDTIEVTGSRIKRSDYETESPILVISRADIEKSGMVSIGEILQNLPQAGAALSRAFNNGGNGATEVDLRNLGSNRVLVLVNGRRWVGGTNPLNTSGVDLSTIPISVIDSIEVLKDGASAVYGSDAIAGVINIKTKRDFVGAEARGHWDATIKGDGQQKLISLAAGTVAGKTSVFFNIDYVDQDALFSGKRHKSSFPTYGTGTSRGSSFSPYGRLIFIPTNNNANAINSLAGATPTETAPCYDITAGLGSNTTVYDGNGTAPTDTPAGQVPGAPATGQPLITPNFPTNLPAGGGAYLCDLTINPATFVLGNSNPSLDAPPGTNPAIGHQDWIRWDANTTAWNYAPMNYLITPVQRSSIYGQISHQILDNLRFSSELLYNHRTSQQQLAETPVACGDAFGHVRPFELCNITMDDPYNPTNPQSPHYIPGTQPQDIAIENVLGSMLRRFTELGPRLFTQRVDTSRVGMGLDGSFGGDGLFADKPVLGTVFNRLYSWDAGWANTATQSSDTDAGLIDGARLAKASNGCTGLDDDDATDCVPVDWFGGPNSLTPEMINYIAYTGVDQTRQTQNLGYANISSEIGEMSRWLAGPLGVALGLEYRKEYFDLHPDPLKVNTTSSTNSIKPTNGSYDAKEAYVELRIPALADVMFDNVPGLNKIGYLKGRSFVKELEVSLAGRYSQYSGFGDNISGKGGIRYKPYDDLILRTTYSSAFRAPAITDLYLGQLVSFAPTVDVCAGRNGKDRDGERGIENVRANCDAENAASQQLSSQIPTTFGGNPDLKPETAHTLSAGFVYSPSYIQDFNVYFDWYSVHLKNFISPIGSQLILDLCYRAPPGQRAYCDLVSRGEEDPSNGFTGRPLQTINAVFQNFSGVEVEGIDMNADWILPLPEVIQQYGSFKWQIDVAHVTKWVAIVPTGLGTEEQGAIGLSFGGFGGIPRTKFNTGLGFSRGNWEASWNIRYIHRLTEFCDDGRQDTGAPHQSASEGVLGNPTKVNSLSEYGLCSEPNAGEHTVQSIDPTTGQVTETRTVYEPRNEMKWIAYHDVQGNYSLPNWNTKITFGVNNLFNQDPPLTYTAFADSYEKSIYDTYDSMTPYVGFQVSF